jgi:hypothetical protein
VAQGFSLLAEVEEQTRAHAGLQKTIQRTYDQLYAAKNTLRQKGLDTYAQNRQILVQYVEGLEELKKYELHPALQREGKRHLIDVYYDEAQMNKWRDSCVRSNESLKAKLEKIDRSYSTMRVPVQEASAASLASE